MTYEDLINLSTKGNKQALRGLFKLGEALIDKKDFDEASNVFKESAISYRIAAARNIGIANSLLSEVEALKQEVKFTYRWLDSNPNGFKDLPIFLTGINKEFVLQELRDKIWHDKEFENLISYLESSLIKHGMSFYSPGGSSLRRIVGLLNDYFGLTNDIYKKATNSSVKISNVKSQFIQHIDVRIGLDLLADEIEKRLLNAQV
jgi:hypothetical protein